MALFLHLQEIVRTKWEIIEKEIIVSTDCTWYRDIQQYVASLWVSQGDGGYDTTNRDYQYWYTMVLDIVGHAGVFYK